MAIDFYPNKNMRTLFIFLTVLSAFVLSACAGVSNSPTGQWQLDSFGDVKNPTSASPDIEAYIFLSDEGHYNGFVGCNKFGGGYERGWKDEIKTITKSMSCSQTSEQEKEILHILTAKTIKYSLEKDQLIFLSEDETYALIFTKYQP